MICIINEKVNKLYGQIDNIPAPKYRFRLLSFVVSNLPQTNALRYAICFQFNGKNSSQLLNSASVTLNVSLQLVTIALDNR